ncbi:hypothetical protein DSO57_1036862 [Entomophthora muscae]|uniref:Uncharacterized protein n=1 Tax=Entomophthora muscae TaxID=34485 RepID=A0ACC2RQ29_9FUNG|nr:hypothetical protein DSO57_1036862 [Entomophthora muscae]
MKSFIVSVLLVTNARPIHVVGMEEIGYFVRRRDLAYRQPKLYSSTAYPVDYAPSEPLIPSAEHVNYPPSQNGQEMPASQGSVEEYTPSNPSYDNDDAPASQGSGEGYPAPYTRPIGQEYIRETVNGISQGYEEYMPSQESTTSSISPVKQKTSSYSSATEDYMSSDTDQDGSPASHSSVEYTVTSDGGGTYVKQTISDNRSTSTKSYHIPPANEYPIPKRFLY